MFHIGQFVKCIDRWVSAEYPVIGDIYKVADVDNTTDKIILQEVYEETPLGWVPSVFLVQAKAIDVAKWRKKNRNLK